MTLRRVLVAGLAALGLGLGAVGLAAAPAAADHACTTTTGPGPDGISGNADDTSTTTCDDTSSGAIANHTASSMRTQFMGAMVAAIPIILVVVVAKRVYRWVKGQ